jgi:4-hydroxybenzoate polyprenyltransferase
MSILPDAAAANWVDRFVPAALRPWLKLGRFDRPIGIWLLMLPGWQAIALAGAMNGAWPDLRLLLLFFVGAALMRAAGCAYNDIVDRDIDQKVARTAARPVASGQISVAQAWLFILACCLVSLMILLSLNFMAILLGVGSLSLVAAYPFMKRITWWPQAWLGLTFNWGALLGFAAVTGELGLPAFLLYASGIFWTLGYDTIYAIQDIEDDILAGVKSAARRLGQNVRSGVGVFYGASFALAMAALAAGLGAPAVFLVLPFGAHLTWQVWRLDPNRSGRALMLFKSNRFAGLILFLAIIAAGLA